MKKLLMVVPMMLLGASMSYAQLDTQGTSTLSVTVGPEAAIVVGATAPFASAGIFKDYTATTGLTYYVRTGASVATAGITVQITTDFSTGGPGGGPSVLTPPTSGDALTFVGSGDQPGGHGTATYVSGTASTTLAKSIVSFGVNAQSLKAGNSASVAWTLTNDPSYAAGTYNTAVATFTISAT